MSLSTEKLNDEMKSFDFSNQTTEDSDGSRYINLPSARSFNNRYEDNLNTVYDLFQRAIRLASNGSGNHLGWRSSGDEKTFKWVTYGQVDHAARRLGSYMITSLGLQPGKEQIVGLYSKNRPEWVIADFACVSYSLISVALYDTLGSESIEFILNQTEMAVVVCESSEKALKLMSFQAPHLKSLIVMDNAITSEAQEKADLAGIRLVAFSSASGFNSSSSQAPYIENESENHDLQPVHPPSASDIFTINYTSGTTGLPKGAVLTHHNIMSVMASTIIALNPAGLQMGQERHLSYLPLAHTFERLSQLIVLSYASAAGFYLGDVRKLAEDLQLLKPTYLITVPRLLNRFYALANAGIQALPQEHQQMFKMAYEKKKQLVFSKRLVDKTSLGPLEAAFTKIRDTFGGELKLMITGSAPVSGEVLEFFRVVGGFYLMEGYGTTEVMGASGISLPGDADGGQVGPPLLCSKYKLADVPELDIQVKRDGRGEVLIGGENVFRGYYKNEAKTKEVVDEEGWYHTGDIGSFDQAGRLRIVDRVKHIFKLSQGEYIAPEKIESVYARSPLVGQVFVYGNSLKSALVAVVAPDEQAMAVYCQKAGIPFTSMQELANSDQVKQTIMGSLLALGKENGLQSFEQVRDIYLHPEPFTTQNGLLTASLKSKRHELQRFFKPQIDSMYQNID